MDAVEFLKERRRMCNAQDACETCPIDVECRDYFVNHEYYPDIAEKMIATVEQWAKECPGKTRQSEFLKLFPNAQRDSHGVVNISPCKFDMTIKRVSCSSDCARCRRDYWRQEVE